VLKRISIWSAKKNKIEAVSKWFMRPNLSVCRDSAVKENRIKQIRFIWTVVEKAITTLESICTSIFKVESITPISAK
jgi:hypothetical protein